MEYFTVPGCHFEKRNHQNTGLAHLYTSTYIFLKNKFKHLFVIKKQQPKTHPVLLVIHTLLSGSHCMSTGASDCTVAYVLQTVHCSSKNAWTRYYKTCEVCTVFHSKMQSSKAVGEKTKHTHTHTKKKKKPEMYMHVISSDLKTEGVHTNGNNWFCTMRHEFCEAFPG